MRTLTPSLDKLRLRNHTFPTSSGMVGAFLLTVAEDDVATLLVISSGPATSDDPTRPEAWEHVSVSLRHRCPTWDEMCRVKSLFWGAHECVIQYHPPRSEHVNNHQYCLHLWKPPVEVLLPPRECV